jgi:hypothetical protein
MGPSSIQPSVQPKRKAKESILTKKSKSITQHESQPSHTVDVNPQESISCRKRLHPSDNEDNIIPAKRPDVFSDEPNEYSASGLKHTLHGNIYQLKLLMLFLKRGLEKRYTFRLATEMDAAKKFDDLVFQYQNERQDGRVYRFLLAKHKQDETKKIISGDLLMETDDEFSLQKYFISYRKVKQSPEFKGELKDFILCTNINFDFNELQQAQINTKRITDSDDILEITSLGKSAVRYQLVVDNQSELYKILRKTSDAHRLAKALVEHIYNGKDITLRSDIFKSYYMAQSKKINDIYVENKKDTNNKKEESQRKIQR